MYEVLLDIFQEVFCLKTNMSIAQIVSTVCLTAMGITALIVDGNLGTTIMTVVGAGFGVIIGYEFTKPAADDATEVNAK